MPPLKPAEEMLEAATNWGETSWGRERMRAMR
jgi:hypothetical protein